MVQDHIIGTQQYFTTEGPEGLLSYEDDEANIPESSVSLEIHNAESMS